MVISVDDCVVSCMDGELYRFCVDWVVSEFYIVVVFGFIDVRFSWGSE